MRTAIQTAAFILAVCPATAGPGGQDAPREYQVKAGYLINFVKYVHWPPGSERGPYTICVAGRDPFDGALHEAVRGEVIDQRTLQTRVVDAPDPSCNVVFVPEGIDGKPYLDAARDTPTLTVGEHDGFLKEGGIINFIFEGGSVRFEIDAAAAARADLRISSHLLRLARRPGRQGRRG